MPLEALRFDVTPIGLHYLLTHYDIPVVDPSSWRLEIDGWVERPLSLSLDELRARPAHRAGGDDGVRRKRARARRAARRQPAVAARGGRDRALARDAGRASARGGRGSRRCRGGPLHRSRPRGRGRGGAVLRTQPAARGGAASRRPARVRGERRAAPAAARLPAPASRSGLVRDDERQVARRNHGLAVAVRRLSAAALVPAATGGGRGGRDPLSRIQVRALHGAARDSGVSEPIEDRARRGRCELEGRAWSGEAEVAGVEVSMDGAETWEEAELGLRTPSAAGRGGVELRVGRAAGRVRALLPRAGRAGERPAARAAVELGGYANNAVQRVPVTCHRLSPPNKSSPIVSACAPGYIACGSLAVLLGRRGHRRTRADGRDEHASSSTASSSGPSSRSTPGQRSLGLMHRQRAPKDGMLFVFPEPTGGGLLDEEHARPVDGSCSSTREARSCGPAMTPCRRDPCPIYEPWSDVPLRARAAGRRPSGPRSNSGRRAAAPAADRGARADRRHNPS